MDAMAGLPRAIVDRIEIERGGCWHWQGTMGSVPGIMMDGQRLSVRRLVWEWYHGARLPANVRLQRTCLSPDCVNPAHAMQQGYLANVKRRLFLTREEGVHGDPGGSDSVSA